VHEVKRLTPTIVEVVVRAALAARKFQPGQFYRPAELRDARAARQGTRMQMEGLALTGAWVDRERGLVSTIVLEMGGSSDLCAMLKPGEPVILMGPTAPHARHLGRDGPAMRRRARERGALLDRAGVPRRGLEGAVFAGYKKVMTRYKEAEIENAADASSGAATRAGVCAPRAQDRTFVGNIVQAIDAYAEGRLGPARSASTTPPHHCHRLRTHDGGRRQSAPRRSEAHLKPVHSAIGSINSPMQCMMKETAGSASSAP